MPDRGNSTPIVWNDRVFLTQSLEKEGRRLRFCFARADGNLLWEAGITYQGKDLFGASLYLKTNLNCPVGGTYSLNAVSLLPTCSRSASPDLHSL